MNPLVPSNRTVPLPGYEAPGYRVPVAPPTASIELVLVITSLKLYWWVNAALVICLANISDTAQRLLNINSKCLGVGFFILLSIAVELEFGSKLAESIPGVLAHEKAPPGNRVHSVCLAQIICGRPVHAP